MRVHHTGAALRGVLFVLTLALLALRAPAGSARRVAAQSNIGAIYATQAIWLIPHLTLSAADGTTSDVAPQLIAAASAAPGATVDLGGGLTYTDAPGLSGTAVDGAGTPLDTVATRVGVLSDTNADANSPKTLMVIASSSFNQANAYLDDTSRLNLNLSTVPAAAMMTGGTISFVLFETLPPMIDNPEPGLDDLGVLAQRWQGGHFQVLGTPDASGAPQAAIVQAPLTLPSAAMPATTPAADQARYQQSGAGASWNALGADGQAQPLTANAPSPTLARAVKKADGPVTPKAARLSFGSDYYGCVGATAQVTCLLTISGTGSYDTAELLVLGGKVHADITFSVVAQIYGMAFHHTAELLTMKLDETYSGAGNAAGCTTRSLPSVPTPPHIMGNHFHDDFNPAFSAGNIFSEPRSSSLQVAGSIDGNWLRNLSLADVIAGESWQCEKGPGFQVEIGAPALNNFELPARIDLGKDVMNLDSIATIPEPTFYYLYTMAGAKVTATRGRTDATTQLHVLCCAPEFKSGFLDILVHFSETVLLHDSGSS